MNTTRLLLACVAVLSLHGCLSLDTRKGHPPEDSGVDSATIVDGAIGSDAEGMLHLDATTPDSGSVLDASNDDSGNEGCSASAPCAQGVCDTSVGECVDCLGEQDCSGTAVCSPNHLCVECVENTDCGPELPVCGTDNRCGGCTDSDNSQCTRFAGATTCAPSGACVECVESTDCSSSAPHCGSDNKCTSCVEDADCSRFAKVCDESAHECVQCTGKKTAQCGADVCDSLQRTCATGVKPASSDLCKPCVSDAHCPSGSLCTPTQFGGTDTGYVCLPKRDLVVGTQGSCINDHRPYVATINAGVGAPIASIDGTTLPICTLRVATCQALNDFSNKPCTGSSDDSACGVVNLDDGVCAQVPADTAFRCSVPCLGNDDCKLGSTCNGSGYCTL